MAIQNSFPAFKPTLLLDFAKTKRLDPRITFARTTTATYYDGDTVAKAEENLATYSQEFDNAAWTKQACAATANTTAAPDGTTTAETITLNVGAGVHAFYQTISAFTGGRVASIFVKAGTHQYVQLSFNSDATPWANFTITAGAGAVGSTGTNQTASIVDVGNGWYRCVLYTASTTATNFYVTVVSSSTSARQESWTAAGTETIYAWGAQLEQRSSVTAYTATTTQPITNYIPVLLTAPAGAARFNHDPVTEESLGLLIEEQRTNLLTYSADFSNAAWTKTRSSITSNTIVAPDGTLTGDKLVEDTTATNTHFIYPGNYVATSTTLTTSVFLKAAERPRALIEISNFLNGSASAIFNLTTGVVSDVGSTTADYTNVSASIQSVGNGWYRCILTATKGTANSSNYFVINLDNGTTRTYTGNGYSGLFLWGAQLEVGAFPTSYIPTVAATVTRNADAASMTGSNFTSWFNAAEGAIYTEYNERAFSQIHQIVFFTSPNPTNGRINFVVNSSNVLDVQVVLNNSDSFSGNSPTLTSGDYKIAFAYATNNAGVSVNGSSVTTDTSVTLPIDINRLFVGSSSFGTNYLNSTIKKIAYYPLRVTNAQLQALTS
jgi:hypothetical protein